MVLKEPPQINQFKAWKMYVDGDKNILGVRRRVVLKSQEWAIFEHCLRLNFPTIKKN